MIALSSTLIALHRLPVVVRPAPDASSLTIEVRIHGQPAKALQRPASEALASSLCRVSKALASSKTRSQTVPEPCFLFDACGAQLDQSMRAHEAWLSAAHLRIGRTHLDVLCEPSEVVSLVLPSAPLVGVPITPFVQTRGCDEQQCHWTWERLPLDRTAADGWQQVGSEREYWPTRGDLGARLRVRAAPLASSPAESAASSFLARVVEAAEPVSAPPPRRSLYNRVAAMPTARRADGFRVLSYNLLADCYSRHWDGAGSVHSYCAPRLTRAPWRMARLLEEVLAFGADLVLLQEVDRSWFELHWAPAMRARGYDGVFTKKAHTSSAEGVAAFVRAAVFELVGGWVAEVAGAHGARGHRRSAGAFGAPSALRLQPVAGLLSARAATV